MELSKLLNSLGENREQYFNAVVPPIIQSSNFAFDSVQDFRQLLEDELDNTIYTRGCNPTVAILRKKLAALEGADDALVFASGAGAIAAGVIGNIKAGDHVICVQEPYGWTNKLLSKLLSRFAISHSFVDGRNIKAIEAAIRPETSLLILESPNTMTFDLQDLAACVSLAKKHQLITLIDNSYCSPLYQQPIKMGIDISIHSASKYLNGHSDIVAGVLCSNKKMIRKLFDSELMTLGGVISPNDAWLMLRGLRTLPLRLQRSNESASKIVRYLELHPKVEKVYFPFSKKFPQYDLAKKQMTGTGGLFSIELKAERIEQVEAFCNQLKTFLMAVSWGGYESLIFPICGIYNVKGRENPKLPWNFIRFYIGLEDPDYLLADIEQALATI